MSDSRSTPRGDEPTLRPHVFDGIQEFDQRLPNWWLFTLYIMIAFTLFYWVGWYQFGWFTTDADSVDAKVAAVQASKPSAMALMSNSDADVQLWKLSRNPDNVAKGKETFDAICSACHAKDLTAKIGGVPLPGLPLNDEEWKYGGKPTDVLKIVVKGSPDITKGMVAWEPQLGATKCQDAVAYILSHHQPPAGMLDAPPASAAAPDAAPATPAAQPAATN